MRVIRLAIITSMAVTLLSSIPGTGPWAIAAVSATTGPSLAVDATADNWGISPYIYGINDYLLDSALADQINLPVNRQGGDATTEHNWQTRASKQGVDWYWETFADSPTPNATIAADRARGTASLLTVPTLGWVPTSRGFAATPAQPSCGFSVKKYGMQTAVDPNVDHDCGSGYVCPTGTAFDAHDSSGNPLSPESTPSELAFGAGSCVAADSSTSLPTPVKNDPTDASKCPAGQTAPGSNPYLCPAPVAFDRQWVSSLVTQFGTAANGGVKLYDLDNEPDLWMWTHRAVHPQCPTYDEVTTKDEAVAAAVKRADPSALTLGPVTAGPTGSLDMPSPISPNSSTNLTCNWTGSPSPSRQAHGGVDFASWYLQQMAQYQHNTGVRILDMFDEHFYPIENGVSESPAGDAATQQLRLESTRSLWDPCYANGQNVCSSGQTQSPQATRVIPQMRGWVARNYPGTGVAISEYNWGALNNINGALAQADVLGIFARQRVDLALLWPGTGSATNGGLAASDPAAFAFKMYRNYDGADSTFGDTWIRSDSGGMTQSGQGQLAIYAAKRSSDGALTIMVINKTGQALTSPLSLAHFAPAGAAQVWRYSANNLGAIQHLPDQPVTGSGISATYPANSITLFVVP